MLSRDQFIYRHQVASHPDDSRYRLAQLTDGRRAVLDAGCAVGYLGEMLRQMPPTRWLAGIEVDAGAAEQARSHYDQIIVGSLEDEQVWDMLREDVDAIIFGDVLEHTSDPLRVLRMAQERLTHDGLVIISMPNIAHFRIRVRLLLGRFDYEEWGIMDRTHLRFFTFASARKLLEAANLEVRHTESVYSFEAPTELPALKRVATAARSRLRTLLARARPTMFSKQLIMVGSRATAPGARNDGRSSLATTDQEPI